MDVGGLPGGDAEHPDDRRAPPPSAALVSGTGHASTTMMVHAARAAIPTRCLLNTPLARCQRPFFIVNRMPEGMRQFQGIGVTVSRKGVVESRQTAPADSVS